MAKYRVMIVDDDADARQLLAIALRGRYETVQAGDGLDALAKLETYEPDFMIIDIMMPLMDGYQLCEAVRRHPRFRNMQVLFLSAFSSKENIKKGYAAGANLFLTKPVDPDRVIKNIEFTIQHEPPLPYTKRYPIEQLEKIEADQKAKEQEALEQPAPAAPQAAPLAQEPTQQPIPAAMPQVKARILVVDDDSEMVHMVDLMLRDDFEVTTASNGMEAIERMVDYEPDLMLLDIMMPKMNGYQLLQSVRRNAYFQNLPVVVLSAKSSAKDKEYAARLGATDFLAKPYNVENLLQVLKTIVTAQDFRIRPKKMSIYEIKEHIFLDLKVRQERQKDQVRKQQFQDMQGLIEEAERKAGKPKQ